MEVPAAIQPRKPSFYMFMEVKPRIIHARRLRKANHMGTIFIIILVLLLLGALPSWPHSKNWGYYPTGGLGLVLTIVIILVLLGRL